jgi:hypothetical protein
MLMDFGFDTKENEQKRKIFSSSTIEPNKTNEKYNHMG